MMLHFYLAIGLILFLLGLYITLIKTNAIGVLMGIEIILNAAALNFVAFSHFNAGKIDGHVMALFVIVLAAAEAVVALAILIAIYRRFKDIKTESVTTLKY